MFAAQVELIYQLTPRNLISSVAVSILTAALLLTHRTARVVAAWWIAVNLISVARYACIRIYWKRRPPIHEARRWAGYATLGSLLAASLWGVAVSVLAPPWGTEAFTLVVFIAAGVPAGALIANTPLFSQYAAVLFPILTPFAVNLFLASGDPFRFLSGCITIIYAGAMASIGKAASEKIVEGFTLKFENADLVERVSGVNKDLQREVERRLNAEIGLTEAKEQAEAASLAKSRFLAKMSHEIRTPLSGVLGMNELLMHSRLSPEQRRQTEAIEESARSLLRIIDDILDFSRIEAGTLQLVTSNFDPRDVVARSVGLFAGRARAKGLDLTWTVDDWVPSLVLGDRDRLQQVLTNLIGNAIKFTSKGSIRVEAGLISHEDPCVLKFRIADTGRGIPKEVQPLLFQPFSQADDSAARRSGGAGLGLAICRQLAGLMGGDIWIERSEPDGTVFAFTVRFCPARYLSGTSQTPEPALILEGGINLGAAILVAEDNPVNSEVVLAHLKNLGCTADLVEEGTAAVAAAARGGYDAILMDCQMPGMDGYEATRTIRKHEAIRSLRPVPIIALTASAMAGDRQRALESGMDDYISKPFTRVQLARTLSHWLARKESQRSET